MKKAFHVFFILILTHCNVGYGMENPSVYQAPHLANELTARIAGYCRPTQKNVLMKVNKDFNECLKDRELILQTNPDTVSLNDKIKALFAHTCSGDIEKLKIWLRYIQQAKIDVNRKNRLGMTAYHMVGDYPEIMQLLVKCGADATIIKPEVPALHEAAYRNNVEAVRTLLTYTNPNVAFADGDIPLHTAAWEGHTEVVQALLKAPGIDINRMNSYEWTPLSVAILKCHTAIVHALIKAPGIDINEETNSRGYFNPLRSAIYKGHIEIVQALIKAPGIEINLADNNKWSPLHVAVSGGHTEIVQALLNAPGIEINRVNSDGCTPLQIAQSRGHVEIVRLLEKKLNNI